MGILKCCLADKFSEFISFVKFVTFNYMPGDTFACNEAMVCY